MDSSSTSYSNQYSKSSRLLGFNNRPHYLDNVLFSLFHAIFWVNPFYLLLRNAQKLYHEFQVDDLILSTGVDPVSYKLSLIKYSVGHKLYSLANGLSNTNTKTRLQMINNIHIKKGKWRLYVLLPTIAILFTVICFANIEPKTVDIQSNALTNISQDDTLKLEVEFIDPFQGPEGKDVVWLQEGVIVVLMNRNSDIMIDREELLLADVEAKIIAISTALFKLREKYSNKLFDADYGSLTNSKNQAIDKLIPFKIYGLKPDKNMHQRPY